MKTYFVAIALAAALLAKPAAAVPVAFGPEFTAFLEQASRLDHDGQAAMRAGNFRAAEADFRTAILVTSQNITVILPESKYGLAEAVEAQGRTAEAMQIYSEAVQPLPAGDYYGFPNAKAAIEYALLLMQSGRDAEAVTMLASSLPSVPNLRMPLTVNFDAVTPSDLAATPPATLAALSHIALGLFASNYGADGHAGDDQVAITEYAKALEAAPDWDVANFYYGYGLQKLGLNAQASVAFRKTIKIAKGDVKIAAQQALARLKKPA